MSYRRTQQPSGPPPIDTGLYQRDDLRAALAGHDFATVYRALSTNRAFRSGGSPT